VDETLSTLPEVAIASIIGAASSVQHWLVARTFESFVPYLCMTLIYLIYHAVPEGLWGASVGKGLCGLRVVGPNGSTPGLPRAFARAFVCLSALIAGNLLTFFVTSAASTGNSSRGARGTYEWIFLCVVVVVITIRRSNGFAAVQDLISGTRVSCSAERHGASPVEAATLPIPVGDSERLGPYLIGEAARRRLAGRRL